MPVVKRFDEYRKATAVFRLLAHPARLQILDELRRGEACVCHLQTVLGRPQAYVSQQLRVLREDGVVVDAKDGLNVYYRIADARVLRLLEEVLGPAKPARRAPACPCPHCAEHDVCCK
ncbi:MAG: helix-turn-helix transcriptional regulator [Anaerolineae bacterium]|nr:helix-turn-helix transcriptional regulator [Anaerolineae bacterium]